MIWRAADIKDGEEYKLELCQSTDGKRLLRLHSLQGSGIVDGKIEVIFLSKVVPNDLLRRRDVIAIAESVPLENGQPFFVDSHGMWLSESESKQMDEGVSFAEIHWATKSAPKFAPF